MTQRKFVFMKFEDSLFLHFSEFFGEGAPVEVQVVGEALAVEGDRKGVGAGFGMLQRMILDKAAKYVKPDGTLIFSTCTIAREENEENVLWFLKNYPYRLESLDPYIPEELHCKSTKLGYLQLLPGIHKTDGFFIARFRRK